MGSKKNDKAKKSKKSNEIRHVFGVKVNSVSSLSTGISVSMKINREILPLELANELLCVSQLEAELLVDLNSGKDVEGQQTFGDDNSVFSGICEVKGFGVRKDTISFTTRFPAGDCGFETVGKFAGKNGQVKLKKIGSIEDDGKDESDETVNAAAK